MAKAYVEARKEHGESELLDDIVQAKPERDCEHCHSAEELKQHGLQHLRDAVQLLVEHNCAQCGRLDTHRRTAQQGNGDSPLGPPRGLKRHRAVDTMSVKKQRARLMGRDGALLDGEGGARQLRASASNFARTTSATASA